MSELDTALKSIAKENGQNGADLFNLLTKVVLLEEVNDDLCNQSAIGFKLFTVFVKERIQNRKENLWSPMKNRSCSHGKPQERRPR